MYNTKGSTINENTVDNTTTCDVNSSSDLASILTIATLIAIGVIDAIIMTLANSPVNPNRKFIPKARTKETTIFKITTS